MGVYGAVELWGDSMQIGSSDILLHPDLSAVLASLPSRLSMNATELYPVAAFLLLLKTVQSSTHLHQSLQSFCVVERADIQTVSYSACTTVLAHGECLSPARCMPRD